LKLQIESLGIKKDKHMIFSLDIEAVYSSVTYSLVKRAINLFSRSLGEEKAKIKECLKIVAFGMGNTLLTFVNKYYGYDNGKREIQDKELTIESYKLAWLANL
jgi:hypothetical protein